jgi:hypothetical protein
VTASRRLGAALLLAATLASCAGKTPPPAFAYDRTANFAGLKTYAWWDGPGSALPRGNAIVDGEVIDRTVRRAVDEDLQRRGFRIRDGDADMYVAYDVDHAGVLAHEKFIKTDTTPFLLWQWDHLEYSGSDYQKQSAIVLEIRDGDRKLVWRGGLAAKAGASPKEIARNLQKAVSILLSHFPPKDSGQAN